MPKTLDQESMASDEADTLIQASMLLSELKPLVLAGQDEEAENAIIRALERSQRKAWVRGSLFSL